MRLSAPADWSFRNRCPTRSMMRAMRLSRADSLRTCAWCGGCGRRRDPADEYVAFMTTASGLRLMEPAKRERLFAEMRRLMNMRPGGRILIHDLTMLHLARAKSQA